jgi:hypothetical protein
LLASSGVAETALSVDEGRGGMAGFSSGSAEGASAGVTALLGGGAGEFDSATGVAVMLADGVVLCLLPSSVKSVITTPASATPATAAATRQLLPPLAKADL